MLNPKFNEEVLSGMTKGFNDDNEDAIKDVNDAIEYLRDWIL